MQGCYGPLTESQLQDLLATGQYVLIGGPYDTEAECSAACSQSGSGSGSGGSGSGIDEGCACDPLPLTLYLTMVGEGTCAPINGLQAALNYNALTGDWVGTCINPIDGATLTFIFGCIPSRPLYTIIVQSSAGGGQPIAGLNVESCDPLQLTIQWTITATVDQGFNCIGVVNGLITTTP